MHHFRVELHTIVTAIIISHSRIGRTAGRGNRSKTGWQGGHMVTMTHPDCARCPDRPQPFKQCTGFDDFQFGATKFAACSGLYPASKLLAHRLLPVTDAKHRHAHLEHRLRGAGGICHRHRIRASRQNDAARCRRRYAFRIAGTGHDLGIDAGFAKAAGNQLRDLRAKIDDQDRILAVHVPSHLP